MHGRFSGASSPWYKMMLSSNEDEDVPEKKKQVRKRKSIPKIKITDEGKEQNENVKYTKLFFHGGCEQYNVIYFRNEA